MYAEGLSDKAEMLRLNSELRVPTMLAQVPYTGDSGSRAKVWHLLGSFRDLASRAESRVVVVKAAKRSSGTSLL